MTSGKGETAGGDARADRSANLAGETGDVPPETAADLLREFEARSAPDRRSGSRRRASDRKRPSFWTGFLSFVAALAVLVTLLPYVVGRGGGTSVELPPDELLGTWSTDDPRYADRSITITGEDLFLDLGQGGRHGYAIQSIEVEVAEVHRNYTIHYLDEGGEQALDVFVYDDGLLRLANPSEVRWQREPR